ncbi:MAG: molybdopterin-dependent oxidoreductase [Deltaproteobacteria bacterium]|nr:molybdopterin-dependent oxidoreductase [Deltaproteobacteria bacterium]
MEKVFTNCTNEGPITVTVKDGKVTRIQPLVMKESDFKPWTIEAGGKKYTPPLKANLAPFIHAERTRLYSPDRIKYPLKRIDFDPNGKRNQENRGISGYERISWDEALDITVGEIKRIRKAYGGAAITGLTSSHHNWGIVGYKMGPFLRFMGMLEYTPVFDNPDSWEGWHWGATHAWGFYWRLGMPEQYDLLEDTLKHAEMIVFWSNDPDSTRAIYSGQDSVIWRQWLKEKGVKMIFLDPYYNYTAAHMDGTWMPLRPDSGAALAMAIAFTWITDDTYDKKYVKDRTLGFEEFRKHILGEDDGQPKTPEWAAGESGIPARKIRSLAREWAAKKTVLSAGTRGGEGGACRTAFGTEWARLMVLLQAMQGLGKPGRSIWGTAMGAPSDTKYYFPGYADLDTRMAITRAARLKINNPTKQRLYRLTLPDAVLNPPISWKGEGFCGQSLDQQFIPYTYPMEGYPEVKLFYRYGGSFMGTMSDTNKWVRMYQSPKLEFVVNQDCWWSSETNFADIILPACTHIERDDLGEWAAAGGYSSHGSNGCNFRIIVRQEKCIEPLWESKSDYEILSLLAERLGMREEYTDGGRTEMDWARAYYEISDLPKLMSWEEFNKKKYIVISPGDDYKPTPALRWFAEGRKCDTPDPLNPKRKTDKEDELGTYSGKIEFVSQSLKQNLPDDDERPPLPHYIISWEGHRSELRKKYPLQIISPHPRFSFHTHYDKHAEWLNEIPGHRIIKDNYAWWPVRINPADAAERGIYNNDIVKLYNDRGTVLCIAVITERVPAGVIHSYGSSANYDPLEPGNAVSVDRGGCVNILTSSRMMSQNAPGMTPNSCLIEIEKWEG